jgi:predicted Zn-dependent protease
VGIESIGALDRAIALRTHTRLLPSIIRRVMAHEIAHVLLPHQKHSDLGLTRGQWSADDLAMTNAACLGLSAQSVQFMQKEAFRRMLSARNRAVK